MEGLPQRKLQTECGFGNELYTIPREKGIKNFENPKRHLQLILWLDVACGITGQ